MKNLVLSCFTLCASFAAHADGFNCQTLEGDLNVKVYNHVHAEDGTRNGAVMVISDPAVATGRKTIARFMADETLTSSSSSYVGKVDLRYNNSGRKGELISGTKLGQLDQIILDVDFSYGAPLEALEETTALLTLVKRNGDEIVRDMSCVRYLKN